MTVSYALNNGFACDGFGRIPLLKLRGLQKSQTLLLTLTMILGAFECSLRFNSSRRWFGWEEEEDEDGDMNSGGQNDFIAFIDIFASLNVPPRQNYQKAVASVIWYSLHLESRLPWSLAQPGDAPTSSRPRRCRQHSVSASARGALKSLAWWWWCTHDEDAPPCYPTGAHHHVGNHDDDVDELKREGEEKRTSIFISECDFEDL